MSIDLPAFFFEPITLWVMKNSAVLGSEMKEVNIHWIKTWRDFALVADRKRVETQIKEIQERSERTKMEVCSSA